MPQFRAWVSRWVRLLSKKRRDRQMTEEMETHLELLTQRKIEEGMAPGAARTAARREFGGLEQIKEVAREERVWLSADQFWQDLRFGARMLRRNPGFSS